MKYIDTIYGDDLPEEALGDYFNRLVGRFFKILPLREQEYASLDVYLERFRRELITAKDYISSLEKDGRYINLIVVIEQLKSSDCTLEDTKGLVFDAINICKALSADYGGDKNV